MLKCIFNVLADSLYRKVLKLIFVITVLFISFSPREIFAAGGCPNIPIQGDQSIEYFITDRITGQSISDGTIVPAGTWLNLDALATASGECVVLTYDFSLGYCIPLTASQRTVSNIYISVDIVSDGLLNGNYDVGRIFGVDSNNQVVFNTVLDSRSSSTGPLNLLLGYPGIYTVNFFNIILNPIINPGCTDWIASVVKSATVYVGDCPCCNETDPCCGTKDPCCGNPDQCCKDQPADAPGTM